MSHACASVHSRRGKVLSNFQVGRSQMEEHEAHVSRILNPTETAKRIRTKVKGQGKSVAACGVCNIHRLIALAQGAGTQKTVDRIRRDVPRLVVVLGLSRHQIEQDLLVTAEAIPRWKARLERWVRRDQDAVGRRWRKTLLINGRPSPRLFRWLQGGQPTPALSVEDKKGCAIGAHQTFASLREFWMTINYAECGWHR